jgi:tetratricopeptide (TPR) repeat protein
MSRLIDSLDADIARAEGVFERECLKARRGALLARHGHFSEARFALLGLRKQNQRLRNPALAAWAAFIDGLVDHCETLAPTARGKFRRAHELAAAVGDTALQAESAAWLSVTDLNANDVEATVGHAAEALRLASAEAHAAQARAALVVGDSWRYAGEDALAQPWYQRVRRHAAAEGDTSLVSILLYNMAAFRAYRISLDDAFGRADLAEAQRVLLEAESTGNYDAGVGNDQLPAQVPLLRAQLLVVTGEYDEAVSTIDAQLAGARAQGLSNCEARFHADAAHAELRLGRIEEANKRLRLVAATLALMTDDDDIAATQARVAGVLRALGRPEQAEGPAREAAEALARHEAAQRRWALALRAAGLAG